jgi:hypothetical protein
VGQQAPGVEPIDILQDLYDNFLTVEDVEINSKLRLFPNPADNELTLDIDPSIALTRLSIYDINGKNLFSQNEFGAQQLQQKINVSQLPSGVFFLTVESDQGTTSIKFVKR